MLIEQQNDIKRGGGFSDILAKNTVKAFASLFLLLIYSIYKIINAGIVDNDYIILLTGSTLSIISLFSFGILLMFESGKVERGIIPMIVSSSLFLPFSFGVYLFFYRGLWSLFCLYEGFSILIILKSTAYVLLGYYIDNGVYKLTVLANDNENSMINTTDQSHERTKI